MHGYVHIDDLWHVIGIDNGRTKRVFRMNTMASFETRQAEAPDKLRVSSFPDRFLYYA